MTENDARLLRQAMTSLEGVVEMPEDGRFLVVDRAGGRDLPRCRSRHGPVEEADRPGLDLRERVRRARPTAELVVGPAPRLLTAEAAGATKVRLPTATAVSR